MSVTTTDLSDVELPSRVDRKVTNTGDDEWHEYDGEPLFDSWSRILRRFREMRNSDYEKIATVKGSSSFKTKIRSKDLESFKSDLEDARQSWIEDHGDRLTSFGNTRYGDVLTEYKVVEVSESKPRKTVVRAQYKSGYRAFLGGEDGKRQSILLPIRDYEQWSYHNEVVEPLFEEYHGRYPY